MFALHPGLQPMRLMLLVAGGAVALAALWGAWPADVPATAPAMPTHVHA
jgi:hypothetical protein